MYLLYKDVCSTKEKSPVSKGMYRKVFNEHFNLSFGRYYAYLLQQILHSLPRSSQISQYLYNYFSLFLLLSPSPHPSYFLSLLFPSHFMWSFSHSPKSDTCKECDMYKVQTDTEQDEVLHSLKVNGNCTSVKQSVPTLNSRRTQLFQNLTRMSCWGPLTCSSLYPPPFWRQMFFFLWTPTLDI